MRRRLCWHGLDRFVGDDSPDRVVNNGYARIGRTGNEGRQPVDLRLLCEYGDDSFRHTRGWRGLRARDRVARHLRPARGDGWIDTSGSTVVGAVGGGGGIGDAAILGSRQPAPGCALSRCRTSVTAGSRRTTGCASLASMSSCATSIAGATTRASDYLRPGLVRMQLCDAGADGLGAGEIAGCCRISV